MTAILKVDTIQDTSGNNIINENANTITIGKSGDTVALASGATQSGFGLSGWSEDGANNNLLPASASAGIYLGVSSATASNLLNDYEEGTWTPAFSFSSGGSVGYAAQIGTYRKIGKLVCVQFGLILSSISSPSGNTSITGLPFTTSSVAYSENSAYLGIVRLLATSYPSMRAYTNDNNTVIQLSINETNASYSGVQGSAIQSNTQIFGNATYFVD
jgi:hypothetical protein